MKKDVSLSDIKTFVTIVQSGNFTKAAEQMMCSRSHISKQLAQLESALGVTLLTRTTRTQHLTPQGEAFYQSCQQSFNALYSAVDRVVDASDSLAGVIKINSVGGYIGEKLIAPLIYEFMSLYPQINIELDFTSNRVALASGEFDFVFRMGELEDSGLIARKLIDIHIDTFASPNYLKLHGTPKEPKELKKHRCITGSMYQWSFTNTQTGKDVEVTVNGNLKCKNGTVMMNSALTDNGIIRVPELYCLNELKEQKLKRVFDTWKVKSTPLYLLYLRDNHQPLRLQKFKEFMIEKI